MRAVSEFGKVAVLMGGPSSEREISFLSGNAVLAALKAKGVDAHAFDPKERPLADLASERFERVFIALHGRFGEDGYSIDRHMRQIPDHFHAHARDPNWWYRRFSR